MASTRITLGRFFLLVFTLMALSSTVVSTARAGGGEPAPSPVSLGTPAAVIERDRDLVLTFTLTCTDQAIADGDYVEVSVVGSQQRKRYVSSGSAWTAAACLAPSQQVVLTVPDANGRGFRAGSVYVSIEFQGCNPEFCFLTSFGDVTLDAPRQHRPR